MAKKKGDDEKGYSNFTKNFLKGQERRTKREKIMGVKGARMQEDRLMSKMKGRNYASQSEPNLKIRGKEAIKRVGEYKHAVRQKAKQHKTDF